MNDIKRVRLFVCWSLIFSFLLGACRNGNQDQPLGIYLDMKGDKAKKAVVRRSLLRDTPEDSIQSRLHFHLSRPDAPRILGVYTVTGDSVTFEPLIDFTPGLKYEVRFRNEKIGEF